MKHLGITLLAIETRHDKKSIIDSLSRCKEHFSYEEILFFTDAKNNIPEWIDRTEEVFIKNMNDYNYFMIKELHKYIRTDKFLICQPDGYIINHNAWDDRFLDYDYVGAPWSDYVVGNGGFSLRSKALMEEVARIASEKMENEDFLICRFLRDKLNNFAFAPFELASKFCWERTTHTPLYNMAFGVHSPVSVIYASLFMNKKCSVSFPCPRVRD